MHDATEGDLRSYLEMQRSELGGIVRSALGERLAHAAARKAFASKRTILAAVPSLQQLLQAFIDDRFLNAAQWAGGQIDEPIIRKMHVEFARAWIEEFAIADWLWNLPPPMRAALIAVAASPLEEMKKCLEASVRKFELGARDRPSPAAAPIINIVKAGTILGGVQQAGAGAQQQSAVTITTAEVEAALDRLSVVLGEHGNRELGQALAGDIATMRAQLTKETPNTTILQEAGRSIRTICEGALGGLLTNAAPAIPHAVGVLSAILGIG